MLNRLVGPAVSIQLVPSSRNFFNNREMRLASKLLRHRRQPMPSYLHFFHDLSSSSSHSFSSFPDNRLWNRNSNHRFSPAVHSLSCHYFLSLPRGFSSQTHASETDEPLLPVQAVISLLDSYHDLTGFPWWIIISSSTIMMRLALFPSIVLQLRKLKRISELLPKLPPPFPPPMSGRNFIDQFNLFWKEKKASGCPSMLWFISSFAIQVPFFFLWLMSVRRMSLDNHLGFDSGGLLWFQNLAEYPHGVLGPIFPLLIAGLHFTNVKISFQQSSIQNLPNTLGFLAKAYSIYLQALTLPILIAGFNVPQGSLVYWLTNSSMSLIQLLCLRHPDIREYLGLSRRGASPVVLQANKERPNQGAGDIVILTKQGEVTAQSLSPLELISFSIKMLSDGRRDVAIRILRLALEKDPGNVRALLIMGQTQLQDKQFSEAAECLESAISKLLMNSYPTKGEAVDLLILSSQWAGIAKVQQGKMEEGLLHLERIAQLEEPEDPKTKAHYYDGLLILSSALLNVNRKAESLKYLQKAAAYNPAYSVYFEHLETDPKDFAEDLASSRRDFSERTHH